MNILSIQSWVAYGHVGNAAAMFPMQRLGHEVIAVNTVQFSNHTGYGAWKGSVFTGDAVREVVAGVEERGALARCDGVLSGYMGDASIGEAILDAVAKVKAARPDALYCCDPVIGDVGRGVFVRPGIPEFMQARAVAAADIITPNHFELELLAGREAKTPADVAAALDAVHALGPKVIVVTSLHTADTPKDVIDLVVSSPQAVFACARRCCRSPSTAQATRSPRCSSCTTCRRATPAKRSRARRRRCTACSGARRRPARARSCWSRRRTSSSSRRRGLRRRRFNASWPGEAQQSSFGGHCRLT